MILAVCPISTAGTLDFTETLNAEGLLTIWKLTLELAPEYAPIPVIFTTAVPTLILFEYVRV